MTTALNSYSDIVASIQDWMIDRSDLVNNAPDFLRMAELRIYRTLRIAAMETNYSQTITDSVVPVPDDYLEMKFLNVIASSVISLQRKPAQYIYTTYPDPSVTDIPRFISRVGSNFIFGPAPNYDYPITGVYYASLPALSDSNQTNWFTQNAGDLLLNGALAEAARFLREKDDFEGITFFENCEQKFLSIMTQVQKQSDDEELSGSPITGNFNPW